MGTVTPIRNDVLPAPFYVYQKRGFIACGREEADGCIEHTREGEKRHWLRLALRHGWREVDAHEYLELMR